MEGCAQGAHFPSRRNPDYVPLQVGVVITADFGLFTEIQNSFLKKGKVETLESKKFCIFAR